jgi:hypothetical protein
LKPTQRILQPNLAVDAVQTTATRSTLQKQERGLSLPFFLG